MREVKAEIEINAPIEEVWETLVNVDGWTDWNTMVVETSGQVTDGAQMSIAMIGKDGGSGPKYSPVIIENVPPSHFRWRAKMGFGILFTNDKIYDLEPTESGTKVTHRELFSGIMAAMMFNKMQAGVHRMISAMNDDLKKSLEA